MWQEEKERKREKREMGVCGGGGGGGGGGVGGGKETCTDADKVTHSRNVSVSQIEVITHFFLDMIQRNFKICSCCSPSSFRKVSFIMFLTRVLEFGLLSLSRLKETEYNVVFPHVDFLVLGHIIIITV